MRRVWFLSLCLLCVLSTAQAAVPDIALQDLDGKPRNVNEFIGQGKWVIVVFWMHDCKICAGEIHHMSTFHQAHKNKDAIVLGVTIDGQAYREQARQFVAKHKLPFANLLTEPDTEAILKFGGGRFVGTPTHYFFDPIGRIVGRKIGPLSSADLEAFIEAFNSSPYAVPPAKPQLTKPQPDKP